MSKQTPAERKQKGKAIRKTVPRSSHADWSPPADRTDPVDLITGQDKERLQWLVPIRHSRMAVSAFTFYRGAAKVMAADLAGTPATGLSAQICGDAHLSNFGSFASPEREQLFDINDFDETLPGPWEWDLKRLATSFVLAGHDNDFKTKDITPIVTQSVASYRQAMAKFAASGTMDTWYAHISVQQIADALPKAKDRKQVTKSAAKARSKDSLKAVSKLTHEVDGQLRILSQPPLLIPLSDVSDQDKAESLRKDVHQSLSGFRSTLTDDRKHVLDQFHIVDIALKVVGVGSVGTRCMIVLFVGKDDGDPLFLQIKEATDAVVEDYLPKSTYPLHGQRVVEGQRLMQAYGDIFLGWSVKSSGHQYYWRQFHDMKGSADVAGMNPRRMNTYAKICGAALAHAHARSGDSIAIAGYLGSGDTFERAVTKFAFAYADQNQQDYETFKTAIATGQIEAEDG